MSSTKLTTRAQHSILYAEQHALKYGESYIGTEHLLLGVLDNPSKLLKDILDNQKVPASRIIAELDKQLPRNLLKPGDGLITLTPRSKRVIDLAYDEARGFCETFVSDAHIFLGLIREADGLAGRVLARLGFDLSDLRKFVISNSISKDEEPLGTPNAIDILESAKVEALNLIDKIFNEAIDVIKLQQRMLNTGDKSQNEV